MAVLEKFERQPGDEQDYDFDFTEYVLSMGEAVTDAHTVDIVSVSPLTGMMVDAGSIYNGVSLRGVASTFIKVWTGSNAVAGKYVITARIETEGGRKHEAEIEVKVKET